jgi:hypothetical protein
MENGGLSTELAVGSRSTSCPLLCMGFAYDTKLGERAFAIQPHLSYTVQVLNPCEIEIITLPSERLIKLCCTRRIDWP